MQIVFRATTVALLKHVGSCTALMLSHSYLCVQEVMSPEGSDLVLATHIPYSKTDISIFYSLHIETFTGEREGTFLK